MAAALRPAPLLRQAGNGPPPPGPGLRPAACRLPALPAARDAGPPQSGRRAQAAASPRTRPRVLGAEAGAPGPRNAGRGWIWRERAGRGPCGGRALERRGAGGLGLARAICQGLCGLRWGLGEPLRLGWGDTPPEGP